MAAELDLDDVAAQSKNAAAELAELRVELERLRSDCAEMTAKHSALEGLVMLQQSASGARKSATGLLRWHGPDGKSGLINSIKARRLKQRNWQTQSGKGKS